MKTWKQWTFVAVLVIIGFIFAFSGCDNGNGDLVLCDCPNGTEHIYTACDCTGVSNDCNCTVNSYKDGKFEITGVTNENKVIADTIMSVWVIEKENYTAKLAIITSVIFILSTDSKTLVDHNGILTIERNTETYLGALAVDPEILSNLIKGDISTGFEYVLID